MSGRAGDTAVPRVNVRPSPAPPPPLPRPSPAPPPRPASLSNGYLDIAELTRFFKDLFRDMPSYDLRLLVAYCFTADLEKDGLVRPDELLQHLRWVEGARRGRDRALGTTAHCPRTHAPRCVIRLPLCAAAAMCGGRACCCTASPCQVPGSRLGLPRDTPARRLACVCAPTPVPAQPLTSRHPIPPTPPPAPLPPFFHVVFSTPLSLSRTVAQGDTDGGAQRWVGGWVGGWEHAVLMKGTPLACFSLGVLRAEHRLL
jgi:hypothetical protein